MEQVGKVLFTSLSYDVPLKVCLREIKWEDSLLALTDNANDFALEIPEQTKQNYAELKQRFASKFDKPMEPSTARSIL